MAAPQVKKSRAGRSANLYGLTGAGRLRWDLRRANPADVIPDINFGSPVAVDPHHCPASCRATTADRAGWACLVVLLCRLVSAEGGW